jgi:hypothetical protein
MIARLKEAVALQAEEIGAKQLPFGIEPERVRLRWPTFRAKFHFRGANIALRLNGGNDHLVRRFQFHHRLHEKVGRVHALRQILDGIFVGETRLERSAVMHARGLGEGEHEIHDLFIWRYLGRERNVRGLCIRRAGRSRRRSAVQPAFQIGLSSEHGKKNQGKREQFFHDGGDT